MGALIKRLRQIAALDGVGVSVGIRPLGAASGDKAPAELVQVAAAHEFGLGVPERPFLRHALSENRDEWAGAARHAAKQAARGKSHQGTLRELGVAMVDDAQTSIESGPWAPNAPATIARKGSSQPLIDTGQMLQSVRAVLHENDGEELIA